MSRVETATAMDRLPWLPDEPQPKRTKRRGNAVWPWAAAAVTAVAGAAFWLGLKSADEVSPPVVQRAQPTTTVPLPEAKPAIEPEVRIAAQPQVRSAQIPEVRPAPVRELRITTPQAPGKSGSEGEKAASVAEPTSTETSAAAPEPGIVQANAEFVPPKPWNPRIFAGAAGRVVQIGAFGSTPQAKRGWWYMVRAYPAMSRLPAVVRPSRNSKGRTFYRFQVGTTSQAHSEVLCQRMQRIRFSCAIVGLPWKAKVER